MRFILLMIADTDTVIDSLILSLIIVTDIIDTLIGSMIDNADTVIGSLN